MASIHIHEDDPGKKVVGGVKRKRKIVENDKNVKKRAAFTCLGGLQNLHLDSAQPSCSKDNNENVFYVVEKDGLKEEYKNIKQFKELDVKNIENEDEKMDISVDVHENFSVEKESSGEKFMSEDYYNDSAFEYLKELQEIYDRPKINCIETQPYFTAKHRSMLVDWLVSVATEHEMMPQTIHLAVNYIDRIISKTIVRIDKLQLVGAASLCIAAKTEEIYFPDNAEFVYHCGDAYTVKQIKKMERIILNILEFNLNPPTMISFIDQICSKYELDQEIIHLSMYLSELILLDGVSFFEYYPLTLAAACVALAMLTLSKSKSWSKELVSYTGCTLENLRPIIKKQQKVLRIISNDLDSSIRAKYLSDKYAKVGALKPKHLIRDFEVAEDSE